MVRTASVLLASLICGQGLTAVVGQNGTDETLVHVMGQSGKFTVYKASEGRQNGIQITMDALRELDSSGQAVGASGNIKHSIQTFAAQDFTIEPMETVTLVAGQLEGAGGDGEGVSADKISFYSPVSSIGQVRIDTYIIKEDGNLGPPNETWAVSAGDLKWNIELSSWTWCGCSQGQTQQVGDMVDVDVTVRGLASASASGKSVSLGGGVTLELSDQVNIDGVWQQMPAGYPQVATQGSATTLTFRFPKFTTRAVYDPVMTGFGSDGGDSTTTAANGGDGTNTVGAPRSAAPAWLLAAGLTALLAETARA